MSLKATIFMIMATRTNIISSYCLTKPQTSLFYISCIRADKDRKTASARDCFKKRLDSTLKFFNMVDFFKNKLLFQDEATKTKSHIKKIKERLRDKSKITKKKSNNHG